MNELRVEVEAGDMISHSTVVFYRGEGSLGVVAFPPISSAGGVQLFALPVTRTVAIDNSVRHDWQCRMLAKDIITSSSREQPLCLICLASLVHNFLFCGLHCPPFCV